jgi:hypothetical protein
MREQPSTDQELRRWLTRRELMASIERLQTCHYGHPRCSTHYGGPCFAELSERFYGMARGRALEMAAGGVGRAEIWKTISHAFPALELDKLQEIIDEAVSLGFTRPD